MKKYLILLFFSYITCYSQNRTDTIFIKFDRNADVIKDSDIKEVWILNNQYLQEMETYINQKKNIKEKKSPPPIFLNRPQKFFKYEIRSIEERRLNCSLINFYPRTNLKYLTPNGKVIYIVDHKTIYDVIFFENTIE